MSQVAAKVLASAARQVSKTVPQVSCPNLELSLKEFVLHLCKLEAILVLWNIILSLIAFKILLKTKNCNKS